MRTLVVAIPFLVIVYALTLVSFQVPDLAIGALLAAGTLALFRRFLTDPEQQIRGAARGPRAPGFVERFLWFWPFAIAVSWMIIRGTWQVALVVLHLQPIRQPGFVEVPIGDRTEIGVAVTGLVDTLSPGSVLVDVDWDAGVMIFHLIDASDPEGYRRHLFQMYERWQRHVAP